jgi:hypothetical protein
MAIYDYDVDATHVQKYLAQWQMDGDVVPGIADIDTGGTFLVWAASMVAEALSQGGFQIEITSAINETAHYILKELVAEMTAMRFIDSRKQIRGEEDDALAGAWGRIRARLKSIKAGEPIGTLTNSMNVSTAQQATAQTDYSTYRFKYSDGL